MTGQPIEPGGSLVLHSLRFLLMYADEIKYETRTRRKMDIGKKNEQFSIITSSLALISILVV